MFALWIQTRDKDFSNNSGDLYGIPKWSRKWLYCLEVVQQIRNGGWWTWRLTARKMSQCHYRLVEYQNSRLHYSTSSMTTFEITLMNICSIKSVIFNQSDIINFKCIERILYLKMKVWMWLCILFRPTFIPRVLSLRNNRLLSTIIILKILCRLYLRIFRSHWR